MSIICVALSVMALGQKPVNWNTVAEETNYRRTSTHAETIKYYHQLQAASPWVYVREYPYSTGENRPFHTIIVSTDRLEKPDTPRNPDKAVIFVVNGVHSGEIEGKDACMALVRDICITKKHASLLNHIILVILPIFNIDGHEMRGKYNRINQNGPEEMGWRCTADNHNLNRDYMKADTPEMRALLRLFHGWKPHLWFDTHTTDGADFQYDVTFAAAIGPENAPSVADYVNNRLHPHLLKTLAEDGHTPAIFFEMRDRMDPAKGIDANLGFAPRFSTGYGAITNRPSILVETHMLKPYDVRVKATYNLILRTLELVAADPKALISAVKKGDEYAANLYKDEKARVVLATSQPADDEGTPMVFKAYDVSTKRSEASGAEYPVWDRSKPIDVPTKFFSKFTATRDVKPPAAYIIPPQWKDVIQRLKFHGLRTESLEKIVTIEVGSYRFSEVRWKERAFEGRHEASFKSEPIRVTRTYPKDSVVVRLDDLKAVLAVHLLEPDAPDSLVRWGFFDTIFEQKEYYEDYAMAPIADRMLAEDAILKKEFDAWLAANPDMATNARARLDFIYQRSPYWDKRKDIYPVGRIEQARDIPSNPKSDETPNPRGYKIQG
ncbi:MAG: peptidase M14 [Planctomycetes bacterium]|nr:peptidase M14 [Planctomycetota bacterium]